MGLVKIKNKEDNTKSTTHKVSMPDKYIDDYGMILNDDKDSQKRLTKYVKSLKTYIRKSDSYRNYMKFLKKQCGLNVCGYHNNITEEEFGLNIHHYPFCTEDIIYTILFKRTKLNETIRFSAVADEFMRLHYLNLIGLYPLCEVCHEYKHSETGKPFIPLEDLYGEPNVFFELYKPYMTEKLINKYERFSELNKGYELCEDYIPEELLKHYIYITNEEGMHFIQELKLEQLILELLKDK